METKQAVVESIRELLLNEKKMDYLNSLEREDLDSLFETVHDHVKRTDEGQESVYIGLARATKFLPAFIVSMLAQEFLTPYIVAQVSCHLEPKKAGHLARGFKSAFLGEVALFLDATIVAQIILYLGNSKILDVVKYMVAKDFYHRIAEIGNQTDKKIATDIFNRLNNPEQIAKIVKYMDKEKAENAIKGVRDNLKKKVQALSET